MFDCPADWREVVSPDGTALITCDPFPEGGAHDCPAGQAHFPGELTCTPIGSACPAGDFSDSLPTDRRIVYVQPGATGGDGMTPASPYGSLSEFARGGLPRGSVIALSKGAHEGPVRLSRGHVLWGACAADTTLATSTPTPPSDTPSAADGVVSIVSAEGELRDLTIAASPRKGLLLEDATVGTIDGVAFEALEGLAIIAANGARLDARTLVVQDTHGVPGTGLGGGGTAIWLISGTADVTRAVFERNHEDALDSAVDDSVLTVTDAVVRDTQSDERDGSGGFGLLTYMGGRATVVRTLFEGNRDAGVTARRGGQVMLSQVIVRGTLERASDGVRGIGIAVEDGSAVVGERVEVAQSLAAAVFLDVGSPTVTLDHAVLRETRPNAGGALGMGLFVIGGTARADRTVLVDNLGFGASAQRAGSTVALTNTVVRDTGAEQNGFGLFIDAAARLEMTTAIVEGTQGGGVLINGAETTVSLNEVAIRDNRGGDVAGRGTGLAIGGGAVLEARRTLLERNTITGVVVVDGGTQATFEDFVLRDTLSDRVDMSGGTGLYVSAAGGVDITRGVLERNREAGLFAGSMGRATMVDVVVNDTDPNAATGAFGYGVLATDGPTVSMDRFEIARAETCGVFIVRDSDVELSNGRISEHPIAICLQIEGYDIGKLMNGVAYVDNDTTLQATSLPVPDPPGIPVAP